MAASAPTTPVVDVEQASTTTPLLPFRRSRLPTYNPRGMLQHYVTMWVQTSLHDTWALIVELQVLYYNAFQYLVCLLTKSQTARMISWRLSRLTACDDHITMGLHHRTYTLYIVIDDDKLDTYVKSNYNTINLVTWRNNLTCVHQHIHLFRGHRMHWTTCWLWAPLQCEGATGQIPTTWSPKLCWGKAWEPVMTDKVQTTESWRKTQTRCHIDRHGPTGAYLSLVAVAATSLKHWLRSSTSSAWSTLLLIRLLTDLTAQFLQKCLRCPKSCPKLYYQEWFRKTNSRKRGSRLFGEGVRHWWFLNLFACRYIKVLHKRLQN